MFFTGTLEAFPLLPTLIQFESISKLQYSNQLAWLILATDITLSFFMCEGRLTYHSVVSVPAMYPSRFVIDKTSTLNKFSNLHRLREQKNKK